MTASVSRGRDSDRLPLGLGEPNAIVTVEVNGTRVDRAGPDSAQRSPTSSGTASGSPARTWDASRACAACARFSSTARRSSHASCSRPGGRPSRRDGGIAFAGRVPRSAPADLQGGARPPVRILHARLPDGGDGPGRETAGASPGRSCARSSPGSCAAARVTSSSSRRSTATLRRAPATRACGRARLSRARRPAVTETSIRDVAKDVRTPVVGANVPRKEDDRLLRGRAVHRRRRSGPRRARWRSAAAPTLTPGSTGSTSPPPLALPGVRQVLVGAEVAARTEPIGILRPVPGAPPIPHFALAERQGHLRGPAGGERRRHEPARRRGRARADRDRLRAAPPRLRRRCQALAPGAPVIHDEVLDSNLLVSNPQGRGDVAARRREADVVVEGRFHHQPGDGPAHGDPGRARRVAAWRAAS